MNRNKTPLIIAAHSPALILSATSRQADGGIKADRGHFHGDSLEGCGVGGGAEGFPNQHQGCPCFTAQCADTLVLHFHIDCLSIISILILQERLADLINIDGGRNGVPRDWEHGGGGVLICDGGGTGV